MAMSARTAVLDIVIAESIHVATTLKFALLNSKLPTLLSSECSVFVWKCMLDSSGLFVTELVCASWRPSFGVLTDVSRLRKFWQQVLCRRRTVSLQFMCCICAAHATFALYIQMPAHEVGCT